jgi:hypothetical protein
MIKTLFHTKLTDIKDTDIEGVGTLRFGAEGKIYRWEKNRNATAFTAKQPVCYDADDYDGSAEEFEAVNSPVTADLALFAGFALTAIAASGGLCFGWVQVKGFLKDARVRTPKSTAITIGTILGPEDSATAIAKKVDAGTAPTYSNYAIAMEALATESTGTTVTTIDVDIRAL